MAREKRPSVVSLSMRLPAITISLAERAENKILIFLVGMAVITFCLGVRPDGPISVTVFQKHLESPATRIGKALAVLVHDGEIAAAAFGCDTIFCLNLQKVVDNDGAVRKTARLVSLYRLVVGVNVMQPAGGFVIGAFRAGQPAPDMRPSTVAFGIRDLFGRLGFTESSQAKRSHDRE